jgi:hypothetical protein
MSQKANRMAARLVSLLSVLSALMMFVSACSPTSDDRPLPTMAQLPATATPITDDEPTPTPETANSTPNTPVQQPTSAPTTEISATEIPVNFQPFALNGAGMAADISISETVRISGVGNLTCDEGGAYVIASATDAIPRISFLLPNDTPPSTYPMHDVIVEGIEIRPVLVLESGITYDVQMDGLFVLNALPAAEGGAVKGDFEYAVASLVDPTNVILVRGGFDFTAPAGFCV